MRKLISVTITLVAFFSILSYGFAENIPENVIKNAKSVFYIESESIDVISSGTAFVINSDMTGTFLITNYHVVEENTQNVLVWINKEEKTHASVVDFNEQYDLALLELSQTLDVPELNTTLDAKQGDAVYAVGFPSAAELLSESKPLSNEEATITDGVISSIRYLKLVEYGKEIKILQINADINSGNSGGPLMNAAGEVVGVNTFKVTNATGINGSIDASIVNEFISGYDFNKTELTSVTRIPLWVYIILGIIGLALIAYLITIILRGKNKGSTATRVGNNYYSRLPLDVYLIKLNNALDEKDIASLMMPLAVELREKHNQGALYLKLSPKNLMINKDGITINPHPDEENFIQYKYLAPEQLSNLPVGIATDIYSFCAVLKTMLLFEPTNTSNDFTSLSAGTDEQIGANGAQEGDDEPLSDKEIDTHTRVNEQRKVDTQSDENLQAGILFTIIEKGMQEDPNKRFGSFQELIFAMAGINQGMSEEILAPLIEKSPRTKQVKIIPILAIELIITLLIAGGIFLYQSNRVDQLNAAIVEHDFYKAKALSEKVIFPERFIPKHLEYLDAGLLLSDRKYDEAYSAFLALGDIIDSPVMAKEALYRKAAGMADNGKFDEAMQIYGDLGDYKDSRDLIDSTNYRKGNYLVNEEEFQKALDIFKKLAVKRYPDAEEMIKATNYAWASSYIANENYYDAYQKLLLTKSYKDTNTILNSLQFLLYEDGKKLYKNRNFFQAQKYFELIGDYLQADDYQFLISLHQYGGYSEFDKDRLVDLLYFEDAKDILVNDEWLFPMFLIGRWTNYTYYFEMKSDHYISYDLPWYDGDYYDLEDGIIYNYYENKYSERKATFKFDVISEDMITVFVYRNSRSYTLFRQ